MMVCAVAVVVYCAVAVVVIVFFLILHSFFSFFLATTEGFQGKEIDTTYFYTSIAGWDLRLALAIDQFDLVQTTMIPSAKPRSITTQLEDYLASDKNMALAHKMIPDLKFIMMEIAKPQGRQSILATASRTSIVNESFVVKHIPWASYPIDLPALLIPLVNVNRTDGLLD